MSKYSPRELVSKWLVFAKQNGISIRKGSGRPPEDSDLSKFLISLGYKESDFSSLIDALPEEIPTEQPLVPSKIEYSDKQVDYLNRTKQVIRKLPQIQVKQLFRELTSE